MHKGALTDCGYFLEDKVFLFSDKVSREWLVSSGKTGCISPVAKPVLRNPDNTDHPPSDPRRGGNSAARNTRPALAKQQSQADRGHRQAMSGGEGGAAWGDQGDGFWTVGEEGFRLLSLLWRLGAGKDGLLQDRSSKLHSFFQTPHMAALLPAVKRE